MSLKKYKTFSLKKVKQTIHIVFIPASAVQDDHLVSSKKQSTHKMDDIVCRMILEKGTTH